ncbi:protein prenylyltransferase [Meredithblackwellia eburnea MCA 4105]
MTTNTNTKAHLYSSALDIARRSNNFNKQHPAQQQLPQLDWKELLRKFTKHNSKREVTAQAAQTEQVIYSLLAKSQSVSSTSTSNNNSQQQKQHQPKQHQYHQNLEELPFPPSILASDAPVALTSLSLLQSATTHTGSHTDKLSANIVRAVGLYHVGQYDDCLTALRDLGDPALELPVGSDGWEPYDLTLRVLAGLVKGHSLLRTATPSPTAALASYTQAGKIYNDAIDLLSRSGGSANDVALHKAGEESLYRAAIGNRGNRDPISSLTSHRLYLLHSRRFSSSPHHLAILTSYRQLLYSIPPNSSSVVIPNWSSELSVVNKSEEAVLRRETTLPKAGEVNKRYLTFLDDVNRGWELGGRRKDGAKEVVDIMYAALTHTFQSQRLLRYLIRALTVGGSYDEAGKALKLYVELFDKARETDAKTVARDVRRFRKRTELDVSTKGRGAKNGGTVAVSSGEGDEKLVVNNYDEDEDDEQDLGTDIDSDVDFVATCVFGSKLLCKYLGDPKTGLEVAMRALHVLREKKDDKLLGNLVEEARVERAVGVALGALTEKEADVETRSTRHDLALKHLETALSLDPNSWETLYQLSYQLFELRQISPALDHAREAVKLNPTSRDCWHLLGLLVAAQKDLGAALQVLETALDDEDDDDDDRSNSNSRSDVGTTSDSGVSPEDSSFPASSNSTHVNGNGSHPPSLPKVNGGTLPTLSVDADQLDSRLSALPTNTTGTGPGTGTGMVQEQQHDALPKDETDKLVAQVQIRMTKNVVIEVMEGPEAALLDQQALLAYFSHAYAQVARTQPPPPPLAPPSADVTSKMDISNLSPSGLGQTSVKRTTSILSRKRSVKGGANATSTDLPNNSSLRVASASGTNPAASRTATSLAAPQNESSISLDDGSFNSVGPTVDTNSKATKLLVDLWLMTAASFRRAGRMDDAKGAIQEAEALNADDPDVWVQYAQYNIAAGSIEVARTALIKALALDVVHVPATVLLARLYLSSTPSKLPFAEGLLDSITKRQAWDVPEAWFELSRCYKGTDRPAREKECLIWALQLEETRSVRTLQCLPRII